LRKRREGNGDEGFGIGICAMAMLAEEVVDLCQLRFGPSHFYMTSVGQNAVEKVQKLSMSSDREL
jgi:hypothetical protein